MIGDADHLCAASPTKQIVLEYVFRTSTARRCAICSPPRSDSGRLAAAGPAEAYARRIRATDFRGDPAMLILTRRVGETVNIGNDVTVTILGVKGNQVRVGINAPKSVAVHREEIFERIQREQDGPNAIVGRTPATPDR